MPEDASRNIQDERFQEAIIRPTPPSEPAAFVNDTTGKVVPTGNTASSDSRSRTLDLPNRSAVETSSGSATFAKEIDISRNVIQSSGDPFTIEVVPDTRFPLYVLTEYVQRTYSNFDFESYSMVSPASLVGYLLYMIHAYIFLIDVYESSTMSAYAEEVDTTHALRKLVDTFSNAHVPDIVFEILQSMLPHRLDTRSRLEFHTSYGSVLFKYDSPRLPPPSMFLLAHNQLISQTRDNAAYRNWLAEDLITYNHETFRVANFIGGLYQRTENNTVNTYTYRNWFARSLSRLADSATHRTHLRRPDILDFDYPIPRYTAETYNPYVHLLMLESKHRVTTLNFLTSLSNFSSTALKAPKTIGSLLTARSSQITRLVIKGPTAPTWHTQKIVDFDLSGKAKTGSFNQFCDAARFGCQRPDNTETQKLPFPEDPSVIQPELYLVQPENKRSTFEPVTADEELHTEGMNLLFDAYDDDPSAHYATVISGKLIQNTNVDGQILPLPNPVDALPKTNSRYLTGAICVKNIVPEFNETPVYLYPRYLRHGRTESMTSLLFNCKQIWIPRFMQAISALPSLSSFQLNDGADGIVPTTNVVSTDNHLKPKDNGKQVLLWSSYRHRRGSDRPSEDTVFFYATLEHFFGTRSSLMQTYNLHQLLSLN
ncbi:putative coat protein [Bipolaris maydis partitivirus 2]|uniref:putative coat protein n=1 Tax=Bipolaris maydis partitivirus 2 TaxID=2483307 RepID=UPI000F0CE60F|nr:putative coat protein [Bipolaris maydis partitivirus 2]AYO97573.1 putative coat protein [Bipolaris maydis partitivirus 2]